MKIGVYGLGRFGKFWAELLAQKFDNVMAYSRTPGKVLPAGVEWVELEELLEADALFLCVSISSFEEVLRSIAGKLKPGMVVFDTCSVKAYPAQLMQRELPATVECVATHPMFGPDSGKNGVQGLPMVMHPLRCDEKRYRFWKDVFTS
jgi:prephenate dehydrogenase